jgi:putative endonuclease
MCNSLSLPPKSRQDLSLSCAQEVTMQQDRAWTYMLADQRDGKLFAGATPDLLRRVAMHRQGIASHFTRRHNITRLVWYERHVNLTQATLRRDMIRHCRRRWKLNLVDTSNPEWLDLFDVIALLPAIPGLPRSIAPHQPCCAATG